MRGETYVPPCAKDGLPSPRGMEAPGLARTLDSLIRVSRREGPLTLCHPFEARSSQPSPRGPPRGGGAGGLEGRGGLAGAGGGGYAASPQEAPGRTPAPHGGGESGPTLLPPAP